MMQPTPETAAIIAALVREFPHFAIELIQENHNLSQEERDHFSTHPNSAAEHAEKWHQFGIITHSQRFVHALGSEVPVYLEKWGITDPIYTALSKEIDGIQKGQLLHIVALLHDVGKFSARTTKGSFKGHEDISGEKIRTTLRPLLEGLGLSEKHIDYIATCAALHYELGKLRRIAKNHDSYTITFIQSAEFRRECKLVQRQYPEFALEIGLCFLADNLCKVEVKATGDTDEILKSQKPQLEALLREKNIPPHLITVAMQVPINVKAAEEYLKLWSRVHYIRDLLWLKLTAESQQKLRQAFPPQYANHFGDHVTLTDDKTAAEVADLIGKKGTAEVYAHATNGKVEAVRVRTNGLPDSYGVPHITISSAKGIHPFTSVAMLRGEHSEQPVVPTLVLDGTLELHKR